MKTYIHNHWEELVERRQAAEEELEDLFMAMEGMVLVNGMTNTIRDHTIDTLLDYGFSVDDIANLAITVEVVTVSDDDGTDVSMIHKIKVKF